MKKILVVCTANICRSPMAAALLIERLAAMGMADQTEVSSAGTYAEPGQPASSRAVVVMSGRGIDLGGHRSEAVTLAMLVASDLVLVMEEAHRRWLFHLSPLQLGKVYLLSEMAGQHGDIPDPYGNGAADFERTVNLLEQIIDLGMPTLLKLAGLPPSVRKMGQINASSTSTS